MCQRLCMTPYIHYRWRLTISTIHDVVYPLFKTSLYIDYTWRHLSTIHDVIHRLYMTSVIHYTWRHILTIRDVIYPLYLTTYIDYSWRHTSTINDVLSRHFTWEVLVGNNKLYMMTCIVYTYHHRSSLWDVTHDICCSNQSKITWLWPSQIAHYIPICQVLYG